MTKSTQRALIEHSESIQRVFREHSECIQSAFREHSESIQRTLKEHSDFVIPSEPKILRLVSKKLYSFGKSVLTIDH